MWWCRRCSGKQPWSLGVGGMRELAVVKRPLCDLDCSKKVRRSHYTASVCSALLSRLCVSLWEEMKLVEKMVEWDEAIAGIKGVEKRHH